MDFWDVIAIRRSIRRYSSQPVGEDLVLRLIEAASLAPSGGNSQPWQFFVVRDQARREQLVECTYRRNNPESSPQEWLSQPPVLILVCLDTRAAIGKYDRWGRDFIAPQDCAAAVQNMILAATALGLGSCWIGGLRVADVHDKFDLPPHLDPFCVVAVGYQDGSPPARPRRPLEEIYTII